MDIKRHCTCLKIRWKLTNEGFFELIGGAARADIVDPTNGCQPVEWGRVPTQCLQFMHMPFIYLFFAGKPGKSIKISLWSPRRQFTTKIFIISLYCSFAPCGRCAHVHFLKGQINHNSVYKLQQGWRMHGWIFMRLSQAATAPWFIRRM